MTSEEISRKYMLVISTRGNNGEHKVLVNSEDAKADYLLEKIDNEKSAIKFIEQSDGTIKLYLSTQGQSDETDTTKLLRPIFPFTLQNCDTVAKLAGDNTKQIVFVFPVTISHGLIRGFELLATDESQFNNINSIQVAVISAPENSVNDGEAEFVAEWYNGQSSLQRATNCVFLRSDRYYDDSYVEYTTSGNGRSKGDGKSFMMKTTDHCNIQNDDYKFHFIALAMWVKDGTSASFVGRNKSNTLDNIGYTKAAYFMIEDTAHNIFSSLIDENYKVRNDHGMTNITKPLPFIALYQERG